MSFVFDRYSESVEEYQTRRLSRVMVQLIECNNVLRPVCEIERLAGLSRARSRKPAGKFSDWTSQPGRELRCFPENVPLINIGSIHTKRVLNNKVRPYINVQFSGYPKSRVPAELIPMLVVNSHYSNKERTVPHKREIIEIKISDNFQRALFKQIAFNHFKEGNLKAVVSCIELARALFLHNVHLTRTALRPNGLLGMAVVDDTGKECFIRFNRSSDYPLKNLNSKDACKHLRWLLLNPEATRSFNSIYDKLQQDENSGWNFNFEPPPLKSWRFKFAGEYDESDPMLFHVEEIKTVYSSSFNYGKKVSIYHPKKVDVIPLEPSNGKRPEINRTDPNPQLDFEATPGSHIKRDVFSEEGFDLSVILKMK